MAIYPDLEHVNEEQTYHSVHGIISGWWYTYPSEKCESQWGWLFPIYGKVKKCSKPPIRYKGINKYYTSKKSIWVMVSNVSNPKNPWSIWISHPSFGWPRCPQQSISNQVILAMFPLHSNNIYLHISSYIYIYLRMVRSRWMASPFES